MIIYICDLFHGGDARRIVCYSTTAQNTRNSKLDWTTQHIMSARKHLLMLCKSITIICSHKDVVKCWKKRQIDGTAGWLVGSWLVCWQVARCAVQLNARAPKCETEWVLKQKRANRLYRRCYWMHNMPFVICRRCIVHTASNTVFQRVIYPIWVPV